eukprot:SAG11_NODE_1195_length_5546_cov_3.668809_3_plen_54_part_00
MISCGTKPSIDEYAIIVGHKIRVTLWSYDRCCMHEAGPFRQRQVDHYYLEIWK